MNHFIQFDYLQPLEICISLLNFCKAKTQTNKTHRTTFPFIDLLRKLGLCCISSVTDACSFLPSGLQCSESRFPALGPPGQCVCFWLLPSSWLSGFYCLKKSHSFPAAPNPQPSRCLADGNDSAWLAPLSLPTLQFPLLSSLLTHSLTHQVGNLWFGTSTEGLTQVVDWLPVAIDLALKNKRLI